MSHPGSRRILKLSGRFAITRLAADAHWPSWLPNDGFVSITRTADELSVIAPDGVVPITPEATRGYVGLVVEGPIPFDAIGILASLTTPLADARIPILSISTYETDYIFVHESRILDAVAALRSAGHEVLETLVGQ